MFFVLYVFVLWFVSNVVYVSEFDFDCPFGFLSFLFGINYVSYESMYIDGAFIAVWINYLGSILNINVRVARSLGICVVFCRSLFVIFSLFLLAIVLPVLRFTASDYRCGIFWTLCCPSFDLRLLITALVSFSHCVARPSIYGFWLPLRYLLAIVLPVLRFTAFDYRLGIVWPLCCPSFDLRLLITA